MLLPDLPTVTTASQQVAIALQKAGISANEDYELARFTVRRYRETEGAEVGVCWTDERTAEGEVTCAPEGEAQELATDGQAGEPATETLAATGEAMPPEPEG